MSAGGRNRLPYNALASRKVRVFLEVSLYEAETGMLLTRQDMSVRHDDDEAALPEDAAAQVRQAVTEQLKLVRRRAES